jgi:hypothetical protein
MPHIHLYFAVFGSKYHTLYIGRYINYMALLSVCSVKANLPFLNLGTSTSEYESYVSSTRDSIVFLFAPDTVNNVIPQHEGIW